MVSDGSKTRDRYRAVLRNELGEAHASDLTSTETRERLSNARDAATKSANKFMLIGAAGAAVYFLQVGGFLALIPDEQYKRLSSIPYSFYILAIFSMSSSIIAMARQGDAHVIDRQLRFSSELKYGIGVKFDDIYFPQAYAWGTPFSRFLIATKPGPVIGFLSAIAQLIAASILIFVIIAPLTIAYDYIIIARFQKEGIYSDFRYWSVALLAVLHVIFLFILIWCQMVDRDIYWEEM